MLSRALIAACSLSLFLTAASVAHSAVLAKVYRQSQTMEVYIDGVHTYTWTISTGVEYNWTKAGTFKPYSLSRFHTSNKYGGAWMHFAVFYSGNYAIHGTKKISRLGQRDSKGCIRLHPEHASTFFSLVKRRGMSAVTIRIY